MRKSGWAGAALGAALAGVVGVFARHDLTRFEIVEESMTPVLQPGDYVTARRLRQPPEPGQIVVYDHPTSDFHLVKRVVAAGGATVHIANGALTVDGVRDSYSRGATSGAGTWTLDANEVFVVGDQRMVSTADSRTRGPLAVAEVKWRVTWRYWPPGRWGRPR